MRVVLSFLLGLAALGAGPATAADAGCQFVKVAEWTLRPGAPRVVVEGEFRGHKVGVLLDTGARESWVARDLADRELLGRDAKGYWVASASGRKIAESVRIEELKVEGTAISDWGALVSATRSFEGGYGIALGNDFLGRFDVEYDLAAGKVRLYRPQGCANAFLAYWAKEGAGLLPITPGGALEVWVGVNGRRLGALLHTATADSLLERSVAGALGVTPESPGAAIAGCFGSPGRGGVDTWIAGFERFAFGDESLRGPRLRFGDLQDWARAGRDEYSQRLAAAPEMILGVEFLRAHRVLVANSQARLYFTHAGGALFPPQPAAGPCSSPAS